MARFEVHSHTMYSNVRIIDSINRPKDLIDRAISNGLSGIAVTDHEILGCQIELNMYQSEIAEEHPEFKIALGNEIYLTGSRDCGQKYYHFILIAKNKEGHKALRELSSHAWLLSYQDRGLERVPTLYNELEAIVKKYPNSLIATTACIGGELGQMILKLTEAEKNNNEVERLEYHNHIVNFMLWCKELFGDDFYVECAPATSKDQVLVNQRIKAIATAFNVKMVIGTDAHFLKKEDRFIHKSYLNSKDGEREIDLFYEFSYLQTEEEIKENLKASELDYDILVANSEEIYDKIEIYSLLHSQQIPKVEVKNYNKGNRSGEDKYPVLKSMLWSDDKVERYWVNECVNKLEQLNKVNDTYLSRLEEEARIKRIIGEKLDTNMFAYPITLAHYINLMWECGSMVGAGRGSSCSGLNHMLLGVTQLDPIEWNLPFWRYLNEERVELGDIDIDICPSKRPAILQAIKKERGSWFKNDIDELSRKHLGCTLVATYSTEGSRSTILTACRGYRSEDFPNGIDVDIAQYLSSLVPSERGQLWSIEDMLYGNEEKDRKPVTTFIREVEQYPGLLDIMKGIRDLIKGRGSHASGVILFDEDPYEFGCFMKTPSGDVITQYDLHMAEAAGMTKYDFLVTEVQDKLTKTIELMQKHGEIEEGPLLDIYNKYLHPNKIDVTFKKAWDAIRDGSVINIFQFDSVVGSQAAKKIAPKNMIELADSNGLMRLMTAGKGEETPMEKYIRFKNNIDLWYAEMNSARLTQEEQKVLEPYFLSSYGVPPSQEQMMKMLMDENICGFSLADANAARKIVGKKQTKKVPGLKKQVLEQAKSKYLGEYVWKYGIGPQMGYSFSIIHALAYSFIGYQTAYIATKWNPIYWNTACLIVNSGSLEDEPTEEIVNIYEPEDFEEYEYEDLPDRSGKKKKSKGTNYEKIATAIGDIQQAGLKLSLVDINKSSFTFEPDIENNTILYGLKPLSSVSEDMIKDLINGRPYTGIKDFMHKHNFKKQAMISLIKSGAFDNYDAKWAAALGIETRKAVMMYYIMQIAETKERLTLQNFNGLIEKNLLPDELNIQKMIFQFNKEVKSKKIGQHFIFDNQKKLDFYLSIDKDAKYIQVINGVPCILEKDWKKIYEKAMQPAKEYIKEHQQEMLSKVNNMAIKECWDKYADGNISSWEMDSLCFYYHEHELAKINNAKYGIIDFNTLPEEPVVANYFKRAGHQIPLFAISTIVGTVIGKNDNKHSISLLTTSGVVNVKFTREYYATYKKQISAYNAAGEKKVVEKSWFKRGVKLMVSGFRRDDTFVAKTYKTTNLHQLYKINEITNDGDIIITHERYRGIEDNEFGEI